MELLRLPDVSNVQACRVCILPEDFDVDAQKSFRRALERFGNSEPGASVDTTVRQSVFDFVGDVIKGCQTGYRG